MEGATGRLFRNPLVRFLADHGVILGLVVRFFLAWFLPWLLDDGKFIPEVAYTDIDFSIFSDAAEYIPFHLLDSKNQSIY